MKFLILPLMVLAVSCGDSGMKGSSFNGLGQVRTLPALGASVSPATATSLQTVCNALTQKQNVLPNAIGSVHNFNATQLDCDGNTITSGNVTTTLQRNGTEFIFRKADGLDFVFPSVETPTSGLFDNICPNLSALSSPTVEGTEATFFTTEGIFQSDCQNIPNQETCVLFETGTINGGNVTIHTREWIRIRIGGTPTTGRIGFYTFRKRLTQSYCGLNQSLTSTATLK